MADTFINVRLTGAKEVEAKFAANVVKVPLVVATAVGVQTVLLQSRVKGKASGRPGPNAPTGDYRRSIAKDVRTKGTVTEGEVGTNEPQGRRLEFGFYDMVDSLGRKFRQPAYPHFGPAGDEMDGPFQQYVGRAVIKALDE